MFASVLAGASRAGSALLVAEFAAVPLLAAFRGLAPAKKLRPAFISLLLFTLAFGSVVGWTTLWQRFQDPQPYKYRREMLLASVAMAREKPWTGFGLGSFEDVYRGYALFDNGTIVNHAHNDWAEWAAEGGLLFAPAHPAFVPPQQLRGFYLAHAVLTHQGVNDPSFFQFARAAADAIESVNGGFHRALVSFHQTGRKMIELCQTARRSQTLESVDQLIALPATAYHHRR